MKSLDTNILVYALNADCAEFHRASAALQAALDEPDAGSSPTKSTLSSTRLSETRAFSAGRMEPRKPFQRYRYSAINVVYAAAVTRMRSGINWRPESRNPTFPTSAPMMPFWRKPCSRLVSGHSTQETSRTLRDMALPHWSIPSMGELGRDFPVQFIIFDFCQFPPSPIPYRLPI